MKVIRLGPAVYYPLLAVVAFLFRHVRLDAHPAVRADFLAIAESACGWRHGVHNDHLSCQSEIDWQVNLP